MRGERKRQKSTRSLFLLPSRFRRARDFLKLLLFREEKLLNALVFFSLSRLSCVFFKKVAENQIDLFWAVFFAPENANESVFYHKTTLTRPVLYISLYKFIYAQQHTL
jgi:hypothetical protein